jgi:hypothetical protein
VVLRPPVCELVGEAALLQLAAERALASEVEVAYELLRQRRTALREACRRHIRRGCAHHRDPIGSSLVEEAAILDCDGRLPKLRVDAAQRHRRVHDQRADRREANSVGRVQNRRPAGPVRLQAVEVAHDEEVRAVEMDLERDPADERGENRGARYEPLPRTRPVRERPFQSCQFPSTLVLG